MDSEWLPIEGIPQIPFSPSSNKTPELRDELAVISFSFFSFLFTERRLASAELAFLPGQHKGER